MLPNLESMLRIQSLNLDAETKLVSGRPFANLGFLGAWEVQSQLATLTFIALLATVPIWAVISCMLIWSLIATVIYAHARQNGLPDILETQWRRPPVRSGSWQGWAKHTSFSLLKAWFGGLQPFVFTRVLCPVLSRPVKCWRDQIRRAAILAVGCTLFGVTTAHHLLRRSGLPDATVLRLSLASPFLNVPYRVLLGALVLNVLLRVGSLVTG